MISLVRQKSIFGSKNYKDESILSSNVLFKQLYPHQYIKNQNACSSPVQ